MWRDNPICELLGIEHPIILAPMAGATTPECLSVEKIQHLISEPGREPIERQTVYHRVHRDENDFKNWRSGSPVDEMAAVAK